MHQPDLAEILDTIEQEDFLAPTFIASGHESVSRILSETPEIESLLDHKTSSLPLLRNRYREDSLGLPDRIRLVYFVVFGLARDRAMAQDIISYLQECRDVPVGHLLSPWHPFSHGVHALARITECQITAPGSDDVIDGLGAFLEQISSWLK